MLWLIFELVYIMFIIVIIVHNEHIHLNKYIHILMNIYKWSTKYIIVNIDINAMLILIKLLN